MSPKTVDMVSDEVGRDALNIIADIVGHPDEMPTREELEYMNPGMEAKAVHEQLDDLEARGIVQSMEKGRHAFYTLTPDAESKYVEGGGFPREAWRRQYESVQKSARIKDLEALDRPQSS